MVTMQTLKRTLIGAVTVSAVVTLGMGFLHTKAGRPFLMRFGGLIGMGCPVNRVTGAEAEALRQRGLQGLRGSALAPARPALGAALDSLSASDAAIWAAKAGLDCHSKRKGFALLECANVPAALVGEGPQADRIETVTFAFGEDGKLLSAQAFRRHLSPEAAAAVVGPVVGELTAKLGPATDVVGAPTAAFLGSEPMATLVRRWRFKDYVAQVVASNLPWGGVAVSEQYQSAKAVPRAAQVARADAR
ncbi:MAG: hypothetical protein ACYCWW_02100 [Deltaproteobacteria bacterium]